MSYVDELVKGLAGVEPEPEYPSQRVTVRIGVTAFWELRKSADRLGKSPSGLAADLLEAAVSDLVEALQLPDTHLDPEFQAFASSLVMRDAERVWGPAV